MCKVFKNEKGILGESTAVVLSAFPSPGVENQGEKFILFSSKAMKI